jgi:hypothetical protein
VLRRKWRGRKRGPEAENRQGRSAERRGVPIARDAGVLRKRPGSRALFAGQPVPRKHRAPVGAPPTPHGVEIGRTRARMRHGNEKVCVMSGRWQRPGASSFAVRAV